MEKPTSWFLSLFVEVTHDQVKGKPIGDLENLFAQGIDTPIGKSKSCTLRGFATSEEELDKISQNDDWADESFFCPYCKKEYFDDYLTEGEQLFECINEGPDQADENVEGCGKTFVVTKSTNSITYYTEKIASA
jgi:hypothetical protein